MGKKRASESACIMQYNWRCLAIRWRYNSVVTTCLTCLSSSKICHQLMTEGKVGFDS